MYGDRLPSLNPDLVIGCGDLPFDYLEYLVSRAITTRASCLPT